MCAILGCAAQVCLLAAVLCGSPVTVCPYPMCTAGSTSTSTSNLCRLKEKACLVSWRKVGWQTTTLVMHTNVVSYVLTHTEGKVQEICDFRGQWVRIGCWGRYVELRERKRKEMRIIITPNYVPRQGQIKENERCWACVKWREREREGQRILT